MAERFVSNRVYMSLTSKHVSYLNTIINIAVTPNYALKVPFVLQIEGLDILSAFNTR